MMVSTSCKHEEIEYVAHPTVHVPMLEVFQVTCRICGEIMTIGEYMQWLSWRISELEKVPALVRDAKAVQKLKADAT